eukprot:scaffold134784_cov32-Tisochrysis_lutea.AAC.5
MSTGRPKGDVLPAPEGLTVGAFSPATTATLRDISARASVSCPTRSLGASLLQGDCEVGRIVAVPVPEKACSSAHVREEADTAAPSSSRPLS